MAILNIKVVDATDDTISIKFNTENSAKPIDEYDALVYHPKKMGYTSIEEFFTAMKHPLLQAAIQRDNKERAENVEMDLSAWIGHESSHAFTMVNAHNASLVTNEAIQNPEVSLDGSTTPITPEETNV
jgi:hypothetical protein